MNTSISWEQKKLNMSLIEFLLSTPEFNRLSYDELEMLDKIMLVDNYRDGHKFNSVNNVDGEVAVSDRKKGGLLQLTYRHPGDLFGLFSIFDHSKRSATCTAVASVRAASIPRQAFELLFKSKLPLANHFQRIAEQQMLPAMPVFLSAVRGNSCIF